MGGFASAIDHPERDMRTDPRGNCRFAAAERKSHEKGGGDLSCERGIMISVRAGITGESSVRPHRKNLVSAEERGPLKNLRNLSGKEAVLLAVERDREWRSSGKRHIQDCHPELLVLSSARNARKVTTEGGAPKSGQPVKEGDRCVPPRMDARDPLYQSFRGAVCQRK